MNTHAFRLAKWLVDAKVIAAGKKKGTSSALMDVWDHITLFLLQSLLFYNQSSQVNFLFILTFTIKMHNQHSQYVYTSPSAKKSSRVKAVYFILITYLGALGRWFSSYVLLLQRTWVWFPVPIWVGSQPSLTSAPRGYHTSGLLRHQHSFVCVCVFKGSLVWSTQGVPG